MENGQLFYMGGRGKTCKPRLVIQDTEERQRIVATVHNQAHLGRDKIVSELNMRYYWPNMYTDVSVYVSFQT